MKKILIIDDEEDILEIIKEAINEVAHYAITTINCSEEAIKILQDQSFDLVITDILMPKLNGLKLIDYIKSHFPDTKIIACSGGGDSGALVASLALDQALNEGAVKTLMKPFTPEELQKLVLNCMKK